MFWKRVADQPLVPHRIELNKMAEAVVAQLVSTSIRRPKYPGIDRHVPVWNDHLHGLSHQLTPPEVHALVLVCL